MNEKIKQLAEEAGFCFWSDEEWKPHGAIIDWSADYDREFQKYTELLIKECHNVVFKNTGPRSALNILEHFDIE